MLEASTKRSYGRYELIDLLAAILEGSQQLWVVFEVPDERIIGALTTAFTVYPRKKYLTGQFLGGESIFRWRKPILELLDKFAIEQGCDGFEMTGREGFERILGPFGWKKVFTVFEKDYTDGQRRRQQRDAEEL